MLIDIVVDTNVLVHASNPNLPQSRCSLDLINSLLVASTQLCVDPGFDIDGARNRSQIGGEYMEHMQHGMMGYVLITEAASQRRIKPVSRNVNPGTNNRLRALGLPPIDRLFVKVASNSVERVLTSHDDRHFSDHVCDEIQRRLGVGVLDACRAVTLI